MRILAIVCSTMLLALAAEADAATEVQGRLTSDGCTGRNDVGHGWGEEIICMSPLPNNAWGGGCTTLVIPPGWYAISGSFPAGDYLMTTLSFDRAPAFGMSRITLPGGAGVVQNIELRTPAHYSVAYNEHYNEWGSEPWIWGTDFYQTFTATSPHITRLATKLAGKSGDHYWLRLNFAIYKVNDGPPTSWPQVSAVRNYYFGGGVDPIIVIGWVPYRSNEMTLNVGEKYALRMWVAPGSQSTSFALVARPDRGNGYANGHLYVDGVSRTDLDGYAYISGGVPGTLTNYAPVNSTELQSIANWSTRFGQTFKASGTGLAGASMVYTTGQPDTVSLPIEFQLYDGVGGTAIGPARRVNGVHGFYQGRASAGWSQGEVPLVPGQMYYLEWTPPASGCNTWYMSENLPGEAYLNRVSKAPNDLMMAISEYAADSPGIGLSSTFIEQTLWQGTPSAATTFTVRNTASGTLEYTLTENTDWLSVSPTEGSSSGEQDTITITFAPESLAPGTYTGSITVADPEASNSPQYVVVSLTVRGYPGDMDSDLDVDLEDWGLFQLCLTAAGTAQTAPECAAAHLDGDPDIDTEDVGAFINCLGGPDRPIPAGCY